MPSKRSQLAGRKQLPAKIEDVVGPVMRPVLRLRDLLQFAEHDPLFLALRGIQVNDAAV